MVAEGRNPFATPSRPLATSVPTFADAAASYIELHRSACTHPKSHSDWSTSLARHVFPALGSVLVSDIYPADLVSVLTPIWTSRHETARRVRQRIHAIFKWAISSGYVSTNPAGPILDPLLPQHVSREEEKHHRAVPYAQVAAVLEAAARSRSAPAVRLLLEFIVLTVARFNEARAALWREFDLETAVWTVPASRMKMRKKYSVPLSSRALAILTEARSLCRGSCRPDDFVFPGRSQGSSLSDTAVPSLLRHIAAPGSQHGFRSSFCDWAAECVPASDGMADYAIAHRFHSRSKRAYHRTDNLELRRCLMEAWAAYLAGTPLHRLNVAPFESVAARARFFGLGDVVAPAPHSA